MGTIRITSDRLAGVPAAARRAVRRGLETVAEEMVQTARGLVPVQTGALLETITGRVVESDGNMLHAEVTAGTEPGQTISTGTGTTREVDYAAHVEFGTSHRPPKPFLTPAVEAHRGEIATILANDLGAELGRGG